MTKRVNRPKSFDPLGWCYLGVFILGKEKILLIFISIFAIVEQETLYIENFGPIKKAELDLKQAVILIGPQSSGKSAIAKLISILRDFRFVNKQDTFENLLENFNAASFLSPKTIIKYNSKSHGFKFEAGKSEISFDLQHKYFQLKKKFEEFEAANPHLYTEDYSNEVDKKYGETKKLLEQVKNEPSAEKKSKCLKSLIRLMMNTRTHIRSTKLNTT